MINYPRKQSLSDLGSDRRVLVLKELRHVRIDPEDRMAEKGVDVLLQDLAVSGKVVSAHAPGGGSELLHGLGLGTLGVQGRLRGQRRNYQSGNVILEKKYEGESTLFVGMR